MVEGDPFRFWRQWLIESVPCTHKHIAWEVIAWRVISVFAV